MSKYIFSTLTASQKYPIWTRIPGRDALQNIQSYVMINGGANLASKVLVTPKGVMTVVSDEEYGQLQQNSGFNLHLKNGFLSVEDRPHDVEDVVSDLKPKDASAPPVPEDFVAAGQKPPETGVASVDDEGMDNSAVRSAQRPAQAKIEPKKPTRKRRGKGRKAKSDAKSNRSKERLAGVPGIKAAAANVDNGASA